MAETKGESNSDDFEDDPDLSPLQTARRRQTRWKIELEHARKELNAFQKEGREALARFRDERAETETQFSINDNMLRRLNTFSSDVQVKRDELFGNVPKVDVSRRYGDANDQVGRVAGLLAQRFLNSDVENDERAYSVVMERPLLDVLVPGLGVAMARYVPADEERGTPEDVETIYIYWGDFLYGACRVWEERRWAGFGCEMSKQDLLDNFTMSVGEVLAAEEMEPPPEEPQPPEAPPADASPEALAAYQEAMTAHQAATEAWQGQIEEFEKCATELGREYLKRVPLDAQRGMGKTAGGNDAEDQSKQNYPWDRAYVWEIWDVERRQVTRLIEGCDMVLQCVPDPLQLKSFFPFPEPMMANVTNDRCVPVSDWKLAKGLYQQVDNLTARIAALTQACKIMGVYDKTVEAMGRILDEVEENRLAPVDNWHEMLEKGGIQGSFELFPLDVVTKTIETLSQQRLNTLDLLRQITGMADILRGQQAENGTPGEAIIKFQAASVRMRAWQKRFARFASELQSIKFEIACKKCQPQTILDRANAQFLPDGQNQQLMAQAVQLLQDKHHEYRIQVRPDSIAAEDFAAMKAERTEALAEITKLVQGAGNIPPPLLPFALQVAKWNFAGLRGGKEIEGVFDQAIQAATQFAQQQAAQPQQNPANAQAAAKQAEVQAKAQADAQRIQLETQADIARSRAEAQDAMTLAEQKQQLDIQTAQQKEVIKQQGLHAQEQRHAAQPAPPQRPV